MKDSLSLDDCVSVLNAINTTIEENVNTLCELDSVIGDGDHGTTIARGLKAGVEAVDAHKPASITDLFQLMGKTMVSSMGGASGPLFGSLFRAMGTASKDLEILYPADIHAMFEAGAMKVMKLGKAERGHKTLLDSLLPGIDSLESSIANGTNLHDTMQRMAEATEAGAESTSDMIAKSGRARYAGDRALGRVDAGAASIALMIRAFAETVAH